MVSEKRQKVTKAIGLSFLIGGFNSFYAWAFYFGGYARWNELKDGNGNIVTPGTIMTCLLVLVMSLGKITGLVYFLTSIIQALVAGTMAIEVIDHVPKI